MAHWIEAMVFPDAVYRHAKPLCDIKDTQYLVRSCDGVLLEFPDWSVGYLYGSRTETELIRVLSFVKDTGRTLLLKCEGVDTMFTLFNRPGDQLYMIYEDDPAFFWTDEPSCTSAATSPGIRVRDKHPLRFPQ